MTPIEYKKAANKHLNFCKVWKSRIESSEAKPEDYDLLEIFYLSGYVVECLTIYTIYLVGGWNPKGLHEGIPGIKKSMIKKEPMTCDIQSLFDPVFTYHTKFDFYYDSIPTGNKKYRMAYRKIYKVSDAGFSESDKTGHVETILSGKHYLWKKVDGESIHMIDTLEKCVIGAEIGKWYLKAERHVSGHDFEKNINKVIIPNLRTEEALNEIDFFDKFNTRGNGLDQQTQNAYNLLYAWKPEIRYYSSIKQLDDQYRGLLTKVNLFRLIDELVSFCLKFEKL